MRLFLVVFGLFIILQPSFAQWDRTFTPDTGFRIIDGTVPRVFLDSITGKYFLYYCGQNGNPDEYQTSTDGLNFGNATVQPNMGSMSDTSFLHNPKIVDCHNNVYRKYYYNNDTLFSSSSTDRINFTQDTGYRYILTASDNSTHGVDDFILLGGDSVVYLYLGDLYGRNNCRLALSTDNGMTFTFVDNDPLGDYNAGGGSHTYVDPKATKISSSEYRIFTMKEGHQLYSFYTNDGFNFINEGLCLSASDFTGINAM